MSCLLVGMSVAYMAYESWSIRGAGRNEEFWERFLNSSASQREGIILIYGDTVFHAAVVTVNEAGLSCFLLKSGRLEDS